MSMVMEPWVVAAYLIDLKYLNTGMRTFRMIQESGVLQHLEMQAQSKMVTWASGLNVRMMSDELNLKNETVRQLLRE